MNRQHRDPCGDGTVLGLHYFSVSILVVTSVFYSYQTNIAFPILNLYQITIR